MAFEHYMNTAAPPSPSSPLSTKSYAHLRTNADLQSVGSINLTPEELARIDASLTNFFQQHLNSNANNTIRKECSAVMPMEMEEVQHPEYYNPHNYKDNNGNRESFMRIGENELERLSLKTDKEDFWGGGGGWKTSPNAYHVPQTDPFQFQQAPETPRTSSSMRVMPPTPPITQNNLQSNLPNSQNNFQPNFQSNNNQNNYTQQQQFQQQAISSPFPSPDMKAFDDMKRLYEERINLIEVTFVI